MRAAVLYGREDVRIEQLEPKALQPGEVRVAIEAALTCGTDLKVYKRGYHAKMIVPPAIFGHELAGRISEVGEGVASWKVGEAVVVANSAPCGTCFYCRTCQENLCDGLIFLNGAYAESIVVSPRLVQANMLRLKPKTAFRDAALVEPLACVVQGLNDLALTAGQQVLVIGSGPIGLMFVVLARQIGCIVTLAGRGEARLQIAKNLGAVQVIDVTGQSDTTAAIKKAATHRFDAVVEAVGKPETWHAAIQLVRKGGKVNLFGGCPSGTSVTLDTTIIHYSNLTLLASFHHTPQTIRPALAYIESGIIRASDFVGAECPLTQLPELFKSMAAGNHAVKTLIRVKE